nr:MAG TPA: hypothetical protein [Caudoviricetes sp.]
MKKNQTARFERQAEINISVKVAKFSYPLQSECSIQHSFF